MATSRKKGTNERAPGKRATASRQTTERAPGKRTSDTERHPVEWAVGAISALLIMALLAYLGYRAVTVDSSPPRFRMEVESVSQIDGKFQALVAVTNEGGSAAADMEVSGTLAGAGEDEETGTFRVDYLPQGSTRRGTLLFTRDPSAGRLNLSIHGYSEP